jgi:hypothetical protein
MLQITTDQIRSFVQLADMKRVITETKNISLVYTRMEAIHRLGGAPLPSMDDMGYPQVNHTPKKTNTE